MSMILYPLELILVIFLGLGLFKFFVWLLNSPKLDRVIERVVHPTPVSEEEVIEQVEDTLATARKRVAKTDEEMAAKRVKTERLRKAYGG